MFDNKTLGILLLFLIAFILLAINFNILTKHNLRLEILEQNPNVPITEEEFIKLQKELKANKCPFPSDCRIGVDCNHCKQGSCVCCVQSEDGKCWCGKKHESK